MQQKHIIMPFNQDLEAAVLGAFMIEPCYYKVQALISLDHFHDPFHKTAYKAIQRLFANSDPIDILTVSTEARKIYSGFDKINGAFKLSQMTQRVNSSGNLERYCRELTELMVARKLLKMCQITISKIGKDNPMETMEGLAMEVVKLDGKARSAQNKSFSEVVVETVEEIGEHMGKGSEKTIGVTSGFPNLDIVTSGWQKSDLIILAARPGMGKTAEALCFATNAAKAGYGVGIFSLEMPARQLVKRMLSSESEIDNNWIKNGDITDSHYLEIQNKASSLSKNAIHIDDKPAITVPYMRGQIMKWMQEGRLDMIIVDYLQLMTGDRGGNREQEIASISRGLKALAKEFDIPIIALSQLSRALENRHDKRPMLSDLRESGGIEQDADMVMFLYRPSYYMRNDEDTDEFGQPIDRTLSELIIAKHRNGSLCTIEQKFLGNIFKFVEA